MKPTPAQSAELHILASGGLTLLSMVATAAYQAGTSDHLNIGQILGVALGTLTVSLGASFLSVMHAMMSSPQAAQAARDTENQLIQDLPHLASWIDTRFTTLEHRLFPPVQPLAKLPPIPATPVQPITLAPEPTNDETTQSIPVVKPTQETRGK